MKKKTTRKHLSAAFLFIAALIFSADLHAITDALRIKIARGTYSDETVIRFLEGATPDFDGSYDAWKFFSSNAAVPNLFTKISTGDALTISSVPSFTASVTMDVFLKIGTAGTYTLTAEEPGAFSSDAKIIMKDLSTGQLYDLRTANTYTISLPVIAQTAAARFRVFFSYPAATQIVHATCSACADGAVAVTKAGEVNWQYVVKNAAGSQVTSGVAASQTQNISGLASGSYTVTISGDFSYTENRMILINVSPVLLGATFVDFTALPSGEAVDLSWSTGMESNTGFFTVEHSEEGMDYQPIDHVPAAGNSSVLRTYSLSDPHPFNGSTYYRIKLTDLNGDISYSDIVQVHTANASAFSAFPVPATQTLNITLDGNKDSEARIIIRDLQGKEVMNTRVIPASDREIITIDISAIVVPGVYVITATGRKQLSEQKIMIN